jgi:hypothetical protein
MVIAVVGLAKRIWKYFRLYGESPDPISIIRRTDD